MNSDVFLAFQKLILTIQHIEQLQQEVPELHPEQAKLRSSMLSDTTSTTIKELVRIGRQARKKNIPLPLELSYWLLDYVAASLYELPEPKAMVDAKKHDLEHDSIREHHGYLFTVNEILRGFEKGVVEGVSERVELQKELREFIDGYGKNKLSDFRYGYLLAGQSKKVSVSDAKIYFERAFFKSPSHISKLFTKHRLNDVIKRHNQK